jgi:hypothetical protein
MTAQTEKQHHETTDGRKMLITEMTDEHLKTTLLYHLVKIQQKGTVYGRGNVWAAGAYLKECKRRNLKFVPSELENELIYAAMGPERAEPLNPRYDRRQRRPLRNNYDGTC